MIVPFAQVNTPLDPRRYWHRNERTVTWNDIDSIRPHIFTTSSYTCLDCHTVVVANGADLVRQRCECGHIIDVYKDPAHG